MAIKSLFKSYSSLIMSEGKLEDFNKDNEQKKLINGL